MSRRAVPPSILACANVLLTAGGAAAQTAQGPVLDDGVPAPVAGRAPDCDAPPGSPPHRLPHDEWLNMHGVPFDEARPQPLLHATRAELWQWLRHDARLFRLAPPAW